MTKSAHNPDREAAVMAVIARETEAFLQSDFAGWAECWVQDARTQELCMSSATGASALKGWDALSAYMKGVMAEGAVCDLSEVRRDNLALTVTAGLAHVTFDQTSSHRDGRTEYSSETRVLERAGAQWRILYASFMLHAHQQIDAERLAVDRTGCVVSAPPEARAHLAGHPVLTLSQGRLRAVRPSWDKVLQAGLACAAEQHGYFQHYRYASTRGQSFRLPLVLGETDCGSVIVCMLFVRDGLTFVETRAEGDLDARLGVAQALFGLSEGQMQLARRIVRGDTLKTASEALGISVNTARTHLSRIYAKTGVSAQTALVRTLLSVG